jgi:carbamate kinase
MRRTARFPDRILIAVGGNATHPEGIQGTAEEQKHIAARTAEALLPLALLDNQLVITHGNGPVVGKILMRQSLTHHRVPPMSLDICVAHSQGGIAYLLVQAIENALRMHDSGRHVACLLTQVEVDQNDPAFTNPTKFIGPFFTKEQAEKLAVELGWKMREDSGRGWRPIVASPAPVHIVDISLIQDLAKRGTIVIAGGGGGIPVVRGPKKTRFGVEAVIDKDLTSAHMANVLQIPCFMILTAVPKVAVDFGKPTQRWLDAVSCSELEDYYNEGQFPAGSMGPKIAAAIKFCRGGGKRAIIAHLADVMAALRGEAGTQIFADELRNA